ncbi:MAG: hypothetical protein NW224_29645 [Leptolyngbyaceae cyanobacterium bins.302]|nr:hypothetical protein [Leptolyngbyaceae cyanobacterium bins.302]
MNAPTFDAHPSACPICRRSDVPKSDKSLAGLLICDRCQERLVVSWSGHYVRDPFRLRRNNIERSLRRESHPLSRILRDLKVSPPNTLVAILAGTLLLGVFGLFSEKFASNQTNSSQRGTPNIHQPLL